MLFVVNTNSRTAEQVEADTFSNLKVTERYDLQEWVLATPELQALRYAAYCSTLSLDDIAEMYASFHGRRQNGEFGRDEALATVRDFVSAPDFDELDNKPRIILAAEKFPPEMTATLLWLRGFDLDISAVRLRPYTIGDQVLVESSVLIPLPEAEEYLIRRERKDAEQASRAKGRRERYRLFFQELIDRLREDHDFTNARIGQPQNWYSFSSGVSGINYGAVFSRDAFRVEVYIDTGSHEKNKWIFDALHARADEIEPAFDAPISWERLDDRRASRIAIYHEASIDEAEEELEQTRDWAIARLLEFKKVFGPRLAEIV